MTYSHQGVIKDLAPYLSYILQYYGKQITLDGAVEVAGRIRFTIETLETEGHSFNETDLYEQEIRQYFSE
jgi:hypothetical protein